MDRSHSALIKSPLIDVTAIKLNKRCWQFSPSRAGGGWRGHYSDVFVIYVFFFLHQLYIWQIYPRRMSLLHWVHICERIAMLICANLYLFFSALHYELSKRVSFSWTHCDTIRCIVLWPWALSPRINWRYLQNITGLASVKKPLSEERLSGSRQIATARIRLGNERICGSVLWGMTAREELKLDWGEEARIITGALYSLCIFYPFWFQLSGLWTEITL